MPPPIAGDVFTHRNLVGDVFCGRPFKGVCARFRRASAARSSVAGASATETEALPGRSPPQKPNFEKEGLETAALMHSLC